MGLRSIICGVVAGGGNKAGGSVSSEESGTRLRGLRRRRLREHISGSGGGRFFFKRTAAGGTEPQLRLRREELRVVTIRRELWRTVFGNSGREWIELDRRLRFQLKEGGRVMY